MLQDYYKILEIEPTANQTEIKAAYRRLAIQFHPDKNPGDKYALAQFYLIKEAYETLSNSTLKNDYLNQRWLNKVYDRKFHSPTNDPEKILFKFIETTKKIQTFDRYRIDQTGIETELMNLLSTENIQLLNDFKDVTINRTIIDQAVQISDILSPKKKD